MTCCRFWRRSLPDCARRECAPSASSAVWAEWIWALSAPASPSSPSASRTPGGEPSSPPASPASPAPLTFVKRRRAGEDDPSPESWDQSSTAPTVDAAGHGPRTATLVVSSSSQGGHRARTSASPADAPGSPGSGEHSSTSSCGSQMSFSLPGDGFSSRTSPVYSVPVGDGISLPSSGRWPTSGFGTWPTAFWTRGSSESPNEGAVYSSLPDVLEESVPQRYCLSSRAAAGILRRAQKRGRKLPEALRTALETLAGMS